MPSDHNPDSESSGTSSEPASSHPRPWTSKKKFKKIKKLHIRCYGSDNIEQLFVLPSRWLFLLKYDKIGDAIHEIFQNASCTPIQFFVEANLDNWHPKTHGPCNYLQSFIWMLSFINVGKKKYPFAEIRNFTAGIRTDHLRKKVITMELLRRLLMMKQHSNIRKVLGQISMPT